MGFFKSIFGSKKEVADDPLFAADFYAALKRYLCLKKDDSIAFEFKDKKGNIIPCTQAFEDTYIKWKDIISPWDRRSVIFEAIDKLYFHRLEKWQVIERYVIDRYPDKAIAFIKKYADEHDFNNPDFLTSLAKCFFVISKYEKGIEYARKAVEIDDKKEAKVILADLLHLSNNHEEAHKLYKEVLNTSPLKDYNEEKIAILQIVGYENDVLNSSVYAVALLNNDAANQDSWNEVAKEFYYCPYFRCQHAFWLLSKGENLKGIAKLVSLSQEFPAYEEGVVNAHSTILQFRKQTGNENLWEEELAYLTKIMNHNNWERITID